MPDAPIRAHMFDTVSMRATRRAGRRTNLGLLALLAVAGVTGVLAYGIGTPAPVRVVVLAHGAVGLALLLLVPWKRVVVRRARRADPPRKTGTGAALAVLVGLTVATGVAHAMGLYGPYVGITPLQIHVASAVLAGVLIVPHVVRHPQRIRRTDLGRRSLLRAGALTAGGAGLWFAGQATAHAASLPGAARRATGSHERGTGQPAAMPVTQWFTDGVPDELPASLVVVRGVRWVEVDPADVDADDQMRAVLDCTGGWYASQDWRGTRLDRFLAATVGLPDPDGTSGSVDLVSVTGYRRRLPLSDAANLLLATRVGGSPLSAGHGAPVRLVAPGRRGFWWVKWVDRVEVVESPWWLQPPFPLQ